MPTYRNSTRSLPQIMKAFIMALVVMLALPVSARAQNLVFDEGHIDAFNVVSANGELQLNLKEDVTGSHVQRPPEEVTIRVKEEAWDTGIASVPEIGQPAYFLPQTQDMNLIWPGWDTLQAQNHFTSIDINFVEVNGPGEVYLFNTDYRGQINSVLRDNSLQLRTGSVIPVPEPAHVHANWAFTEPGTYTMEVYANGVNNYGEQQTSNRGRYTWVVGGDSNTGTSPAPAGQAPAGQAPQEQPGQSPRPNQPPQQQPNNTGNNSGGSSLSPSGSSNRSTRSGVTAAPQAQSGNNSSSQSPEQCRPGIVPKIKDDREQPASWVDPESLTFGLGDAARADLPMAIGPVQAGGVWMIGSTQVPNVPWLGANTQHPSVVQDTTGPVQWDLVSFDGPGNMVVYTQGNLGQVVGEEWFSATPGNPSGSHTIPANTHVHPNWVFSAPGTYKVGIKQTATMKDGSTSSGTSTLTFIVGGSGNANEGHFDLGAQVDPEGDCGGGAAGAGGGAAGAGGTGSSQLADTGVTQMTLPIAVLGIGLLILGVSYLVSGRVRQLI